MIHALFSRIKALISTSAVKITGSSAVKGTGFARAGARSALITMDAAASTGVPDTATMTLTVQHSADDTDGNYATVTLDTTLPTVDVKTGALGQYLLDMTALKEYVRVVITPAFSGGSSPGNIVSVVLVVGDYVVDPPASGPSIYRKA